MTDQNLRQNYDVYLGDDGIIYCEIERLPRSEVKSTQQAHLEHLSVRKLLIERPKLNFPLLIDLSKLSLKAGYTSEGARIAYVALMAESQIIRVAFVGRNRFFKKETLFLTRASGMRGKVRWFDDRERARDWLLEVLEKKN